MDKTAEKERINEMIEAAMKVARGDYSVQVELSGKNDDLDALAMGLNMMIDDTRTSTEVLKESEEKFRTFMETASDLMHMADKDGNITYVNEATARTLGYSKEEMIGKHVTQFLSKEVLEKDFKPGWEELITKGKITVEAVWVTKDGKEIYGEQKVVAIYDSDGNYAGSRAVFRDLTERKRAERELQEKNEQLDTQNEELRATEEELRAANEELQAANEELRETQEQLIRSEKLAAIGQLAGGVGHELRNPLGAIKNAVYYVKGKVAKSELGQKEPRVIEFLDIADDEVNSSNKIINDLLGFSRVGQPSVSLARIKEVIDDALSHLTIPQNIEVVKKLDADLPEVSIDTDQTRQVLVNMIMNAVQAMPEGGRLTISAREGDKFLEVEISDTGCGIPKEAIGKIFDPLFTTRAKGIGLGLAVCKAIIDRHQGHIEVESEVGKGTTFAIRLPLKMG